MRFSEELYLCATDRRFLEPLKRELSFRCTILEIRGRASIKRATRETTRGRLWDKVAGEARPVISRMNDGHWRLAYGSTPFFPGRHQYLMND